MIISAAVENLACVGKEDLLYMCNARPTHHIQELCFLTLQSDYRSPAEPSAGGYR